MKFRKQPSADRWNAVDDIGKTVGAVIIEGGVSCFEPRDVTAVLLPEELREIADFAETLTARPASAHI